MTDKETNVLKSYFGFTKHRATRFRSGLNWCDAWLSCLSGAYASDLYKQASFRSLNFNDAGMSWCLLVAGRDDAPLAGYDLLRMLIASTACIPVANYVIGRVHKLRDAIVLVAKLE